MPNKASLPMLTEQDIVLQLQRLQTHPGVAARLAAGGVAVGDDSNGSVVPIAERHPDSPAAAPLSEASGS